jgi:hypothetical protein
MVLGITNSDLKEFIRSLPSKSILLKLFMQSWKGKKESMNNTQIFLQSFFFEYYKSVFFFVLSNLKKVDYCSQANNHKIWMNDEKQV